MQPLDRVLLYLMGSFYVFAGVMHFAKPTSYVEMMPDYLPAHLALVYLSGVAEIACGIGVLIPGTRRWAAWGTVALLVAVFPANLHIFLNGVAVFGAAEAPPPLVGFLRLPLQVALIAWAWRYTRPDPRPAGGRGELG